MTPANSAIFIAAIPPTLAAVGAFILGLINSFKADKIHVLVNSNLAAVQADLKMALERVGKLEGLLQKK